MSSYWLDDEELKIDLLPDRDALADCKGPLVAHLSRNWPRRFAESWCARHAPSRPLAQCSKSEIETLARNISQWTVRPSGTEGYPKAEVTLGGVDTGDLSSKTMEARNVRGLFFIGEAVDVTGWLGGYNFQWAWASGHAAGLAV